MVSGPKSLPISGEPLPFPDHFTSHVWNNEDEKLGNYPSGFAVSQMPDSRRRAPTIQGMQFARR
jgi:hypothetical protein